MLRLQNIQALLLNRFIVELLGNQKVSTAPKEAHFDEEHKCE